MNSDTDKLRFERVLNEVLLTGRDRTGIGTYQEKMLHSAVKLFICDDKSCHEVKIYPDTPGKTGGRESGYIADILIDCDIYEIQTGGFFPLKPKIKFYLEETSYNVTVVVPLAARKWVSWIDPDTSEVSKRHRSPKKQSPRDILPELFWLLPYINSRRLSFRVLLLEIDEFRLRNGWGNDGKRGSERYERIPRGLCGIEDFSVPADYIPLLPEGLPDTFTAAEFGKAARLRGRKIYSVIKVFLELGLLKTDGMRGRAVLYRLSVK